MEDCLIFKDRLALLCYPQKVYNMLTRYSRSYFHPFFYLCILIVYRCISSLREFHVESTKS